MSQRRVLGQLNRPAFVTQNGPKLLLLAYSKSERQLISFSGDWVSDSGWNVCGLLIGGKVLKMTRAGVPLLRLPARQHAMLSAGLSSGGMPWFQTNTQMLSGCGLHY